MQRARMQEGAPSAPLSGERDGGFGRAMAHSPDPQPAPQQHNQVVQHRLAQERPNGRSSAPVKQESELSSLKTLMGQKPKAGIPVLPGLDGPGLCSCELPSGSAGLWSIRTLHTLVGTPARHVRSL